MIPTGFRKAIVSRRARLSLLVLAAVAPLAALVSHQINAAREHHIGEALRRASEYARLGSERFEDIMADARTLLDVVSKVPDVTNGTAIACHQFLTSVGRDRRWVNGMWVVGQDGRVRCSTIANAGGLDLSDREEYQQAMTATGFSVSDFFVGKLTNLPLAVAMRWSRLSEQIFRFDKWSLCRG
jgi:hypothetical protein